MKRVPIILAGFAGFAGFAGPADAVQKPHLNKSDGRVWEYVYTPDDIYKAWSAPGSVLLLRFAPDEQITKAQPADSETILVDFTDNLLTLKFNGCAITEPVFVVTHKASAEEMRTYSFSFETVPAVCSREIQEQAPGPNVSNVSLTDGVPKALPNMKHLQHPDDLAEGGKIPYMITMKYPGDEKAKRDAAALVAAKKFQAKQTRDILAAAVSGKGPTTQFENNHYYGRGDAGLKPCLPSPDRPGGCGPIDDGNTTRLEFPGDTPVPSVTKLQNVSAGCGDNGQEAVADFAMHGRTMVLTGTAPGWCLRRNNRVYQLTNASYNPVGYPTGTGTVSPNVERTIKE